MRLPARRQNEKAAETRSLIAGWIRRYTSPDSYGDFISETMSAVPGRDATTPLRQEKRRGARRNVCAVRRGGQRR
jgi:hypothetical protein